MHIDGMWGSKFVLRMNHSLPADDNWWYQKELGKVAAALTCNGRNSLAGIAGGETEA